MTTYARTHAETREQNAMQAQPRWQDGGILILVGLLFLSPWIFGTITQTLSSWNAWIVGIGFVPITFRIFAPPPGAYANKCTHEGVRIAWWQKVVDSCHLSHIAKEELVVGGWVLVAPWILGFASNGAAAWTSWMIGLLVVVLAAWKLRELRGQ